MNWKKRYIAPLTAAAMLAAALPLAASAEDGITPLPAAGILTYGEAELAESTEPPASKGINAIFDTAKKTVDYIIGDTKNSYFDAGSPYIRLRVGFGEDDSSKSGEGIIWTGASVGEEAVSVKDSGRYLQLNPFYDGTFSIDIAFPGADGSGSCGLRCMDFESIADLTACTAVSGTALDSKFTDSGKRTVTLDLTAGHSYVVYTCGGAATVSAMKYNWIDDTEPTPSPTPEPTQDPYHTTEIFDLTVVTPKGTYDPGEYILNSIFGVGFTEGCNTRFAEGYVGFDIYNDGSYVKVRPTHDGEIEIYGRARMGSSLYMSTDGAKDGEEIAGGSMTIDLSPRLLSTQPVIAGRTYYLYNNGAGTNPLTLSEVRYTYANDAPTAAPSQQPTAAPSNAPTAAPTGKPLATASPTQSPTSAPTRAPAAELEISDAHTSGSSIGVRVRANADDGAVMTAAAYSGGRLVFADAAQVRGKGASIDFPLLGRADKISLTLWRSLSDTEPLTEPLITDIASLISASSTAPPEGGGISLSRYTCPLVKGGSFTLSAEAENAQDITWYTEDERIAYIADNKTSGSEVRIAAAGTGITRAVAQLPGGESRSCVISVIDGQEGSTPARLEFNTDHLTLAPGAQTDLIPIVYPKDIYEDGYMNGSLIWTSSDKSVVTVSGGHLKAISAGEAVIKAVSDANGREALCVVTVADGEADKIKGGGSYAMKVGENTKLTADCAGEVVWRSENSLVADVDADGSVFAYSNSLAPSFKDHKILLEDNRPKYETAPVKLYATAVNGGETAVYEVSVTDAEQAAHDVVISSDELTMKRGDEQRITAAVLPASITDAEVKWSSSDETVAGVTADGNGSALIKAAAAGKTEITAEYKGIKDTCTVTVTGSKVLVKEVKIENAHQIEVGAENKLEAAVNEDAADKSIIWICADRETADITADGIVTGMKAGKTMVYAIAADRLTAAQKEKLNELAKEKTLGEDNAELAAILKKAVYAWTNVTVNPGSPYLRGLRAPEEAWSDSSVCLIWDSSSAEEMTGFDRYAVYCGGNLSGYTRGKSYTIDGLQPSSKYSVTVRALNSSGSVLAWDTITVMTAQKAQTVNVLDFGARGDGRVLDTYAVQCAIDSCPAGGEVLLPKGYVFMTGALFLKSGMTLRVDGTLIGSGDSKDYPFIKSDGSQERHASLLNAGAYADGGFTAHDITVCGEGQINANGFTLGCYEDKSGLGSAVSLINAQRVCVRDVAVAYAPSWAIRASYCDSLTFDGIGIVSENGAIDSSSSTRVNVSEE